MSVGFAALVAVLRSGPIPVAIITLLIGARLGSTMPAAQTIVPWAAGERDLGEATAALSFRRSIGGVLGAAITSAVLLAALHTGEQIASLTNSTVAASRLHASAALSRGFLWMFSTLGVLALMATITTWSLPNVDLSKPQG